MATKSKVTPSGFTPYIRPGGAKPVGNPLPWAYGRGQANAPKMTNKGSTGKGGRKDPSSARRKIAGKLVGSYKKGGKIKKTGIAKVHKGERVLTKKQTKKFDQKKFDRAKKSVFGL